MLCRLGIILILLCGLYSVQSQLTVGGVKCGQRTCKVSEYCSNYDKTCQPCAAICNTSSHNYDRSVCENDCQDYLHDLRYIRKDSDEEDEDNLRSTVQHLSQMVTITLTLVCLMLVVLAFVLCFQLYRWKVKKNITIASIKEKLFKGKTTDNSTPTKVNKIQITDNKKDLKLEIPSPGTHSDHSPVTVTTSISRRPAEDSTLDYAYDNPALSTNPR